MKRDNKLKLHYNKKSNDIEGFLPLSENQGRWDLYLLFYHFISLKGLHEGDKNLLDELEARGYDLTTINFSIEKAKEGYQKISKRFGMHLTANFKDWLLKLKSIDFKLITISKEEIIFEDWKKRKIYFKKSKYNNWYFENENFPLHNFKLKILSQFLDFLEEYTFTENDYNILEDDIFLEALDY